MTHKSSILALIAVLGACHAGRDRSTGAADSATRLSTPVTAATGQTPPATLPRARDLLDRNYPGWRPFEVADEVQQFFARQGDHSAHNVIVGDFDGDRGQDSVILITYTVQDSSKYAVVAFLTRNDQVEEHTLSSGNVFPSMYLNRIPMGASGHDYGADSEFLYAHDAIQIWYIFGKNAATSFEYRAGGFVEIRSVD